MFSRLTVLPIKIAVRVTELFLTGHGRWFFTQHSGCNMISYYPKFLFAVCVPYINLIIMIRIVRLPLRQPSDMKGTGFEPIFAMSACFYLLYVSLIKFIKVNMTPNGFKICSLV